MQLPLVPLGSALAGAALSVPRGVLATGTALGADAAWLGVRVLGYPLGVRPAVRRAHPAGIGAGRQTPVIAVHGLADNRTAFAVLEKSLRRKGFHHVSVLSYPVLTHDVRSAARLLAEHVEGVCAETGATRVHLVGHSLGGIVARWYVQRMGGEARVATLVTLGTPHAGTRAARLLPLPVLRQLRPGSELLRTLAEPMPGCRTRVVSVWSSHDALIAPRTSARLAHADLAGGDVVVRGVGHLALPAHPRVLAAVAAALRPAAPALLVAVEPLTDRCTTPLQLLQRRVAQ